MSFLCTVLIFMGMLTFLQREKTNGKFFFGKELLCPGEICPDDGDRVSAWEM